MMSLSMLNSVTKYAIATVVDEDICCSEGFENTVPVFISEVVRCDSFARDGK